MRNAVGPLLWLAVVAGLVVLFVVPMDKKKK